MSYDVFENLDEAKRLAIINAGLKIFSEYGYTKSSVDAITKVAGISKGSLFYYFESKKNFYLYLYEYCGNTLEKIVDSPGPDGCPSYMIYTDFFERIEAIQQLKMKCSIDYPHMSDFMKKSVFETAPCVKSEIEKFNTRYTHERAMAFFQRIDYSKFKEGINPMMVIQLITWCSEGCANQAALKYKQKSSDNQLSLIFQEAVDLYKAYMTLFRNTFYKEEYLK